MDSLPVELLSNILARLKNKVLKNARQTSNRLAGYASKFLFRKIYVSCHREDAEAFQALTTHPFLSRFVKTLEYDAVGYSASLTKRGYVYHLVRQVYPMVSTDDTNLDNPDQDNNEFIKMCRSITCRNPAASYAIQFKRCQGFGFIQRGQRDWMRRAKYEVDIQASDQKNDLLSILIRGLANLDGLVIGYGM